MIYRDDDVSIHTDICLFKELHNKFIEKKQVHTVAVIMKNLWENQAIFYYLATAPYLEIGLHGWTHADYSKKSYYECHRDLKKSLNYWKENSIRMIGSAKEIKTFFAPWNKESPEIRKSCRDLGLEFCNIKNGEWNGQEIKSFHWWSVGDNFKL